MDYEQLKNRIKNRLGKNNIPVWTYADGKNNTPNRIGMACQIEMTKGRVTNAQCPNVRSVKLAAALLGRSMYSSIYSYYADPFEDNTYTPVVMTLSHGRFCIGYVDANSECIIAEYPLQYWTDDAGAAIEAYRFAEREAEKARDAEIEYHAQEVREQLRHEIDDDRAEIKRINKQMKFACLLRYPFPALVDAAAKKREELRAGIQDKRKRMDELQDNPYSVMGA